MSNEETRPGVSRRSVVAGVAWAMPAVAVAAAVPAYAVSPIIDPEVVPGSMCKYPGGSAGSDLKHAFRFQVKFTNKSSNPVTVTPVPGASSVVFDGDPALRGNLRFFDDSPTSGRQELGSFTLGGGEDQVFYLVLSDWGNSANNSGHINVVLNVKDNVTGETLQQTFQASFSSVPPCDG